MTYELFLSISYEMYKENWKSEHLDLKAILQSYIDYADIIDDDTEDNYTYEDYLREYGFNGICYASEFEFEDNEFTDRDIMECIYNGNKDMLATWDLFKNGGLM